ncbi:MAG: hypothetical protein JNM22_23245 [Saprospiraceae bacterium]|nr:hypothetical protein [Saprospiraceae bacterium]
MKKCILMIFFVNSLTWTQLWPQNNLVAILPLICQSGMRPNEVEDLYETLNDSLRKRSSYEYMDKYPLVVTLGQANLIVKEGYNTECGNKLRQESPTLQYLVTISVYTENLTCWVCYFEDNAQCSFSITGRINDPEIFNNLVNQLIHCFKTGCPETPTKKTENIQADLFNSDAQTKEWWDNLPNDWQVAFAKAFDLNKEKLDVKRLKQILDTTDLVLEKETQVKDLEGCRKLSNLQSIIIKCNTLERFYGVEDIPGLSVIYYNITSPVIPYEINWILKTRKELKHTNKLDIIPTIFDP